MILLRSVLGKSNLSQIKKTKRKMTTKYKKNTKRKEMVEENIHDIHAKRLLLSIMLGAYQDRAPALVFIEQATSK